MAEDTERKDSPLGPDYDCSSFTTLLKRVMVGNSASLGFQGQYEMSQQDTLASTKRKAAGAQIELHTECANPSIKLTPLTPADISVPHSAATRKPLLTIHKNAPGLVINVQNSNHKTNLPHIVAETPPADGYSWRKYGQKQMKTSKNLRSYYRCGYSKCHAKKKVQQCEYSGRVIDVVYAGYHNHDPPQKKCNKSREFVSSPKLAVDCHSIDHSFEKPDGSDVSVCLADGRKSFLRMPVSEHSSRSSNGNVRTEVQEQGSDEPESKLFFCSSDMEPQQNSSCGIAGPEFQEKHSAEPTLKKGHVLRRNWTKAVKEPKTVVHAASDVGILSDCYRWRKYGRKMVKGNSHWRSYYRCTSSGCPARKHVESAIDDAKTTTVTYEGKHDHGMSAPKKRHGPESPLFPLSAAAMNYAHCKKTKSLSSRRSSTKWSADGEVDLMGEKILELGGEKALESAQTLLSIGNELKPC